MQLAAAGEWRDAIPGVRRGDPHGPRQQGEVHQQAETAGQAYRGRLRSSRRTGGDGRSPRMGDRQQEDRRRQESEDGRRPRQEDQPQRGSRRCPQDRPRSRGASGGTTLGRRAQGSPHPPAAHQPHQPKEVGAGTTARRRPGRGEAECAPGLMPSGERLPARRPAFPPAHARDARPAGAHSGNGSTLPVSPGCWLTATTVARGKKLNSEALAQV